MSSPYLIKLEANIITAEMPRCKQGWEWMECAGFGNKACWGIKERI